MKRITSVSREDLENFIDIEKQQQYLNTYRGSEGQDTITPLNNNVFLKQIAKLKSNSGSSKSVNSITSAYSSSNNINQCTSSINSIKSAAYNEKSPKIPKRFQNLFKTKSNSSLSQIGAASLNKSTNYLGKSSNNSSKNRINLISQLSSRLDENEVSLTVTAIPVSNLNQTDLVFDELSVMLNKSSSQKVTLDDEFKENIRFIVKQSELLKKHQTDKVRWICTIWTYLFFFLMFLFIIVFVFELHSIGIKLMKELSRSNRTVN